MSTQIRRVYLDCEFIPAEPHTRGLVSIGLTDDDGNDYYAVNADQNWDAYKIPWMRENVWPYLPHRAAAGEPGVLDLTHPDVKPIAQIREDIKAYFGQHRRPAHLYAWYGGQDIARLHSLWDNDWSAMPGDIPRWFHELQSLAHQAGDPQLPVQDSGEHHALADAKYNRQLHEFLIARTGPRRGDAVEAWLKAKRDLFCETHDSQWEVIDDLLGAYRLHADTGAPLGGCYEAAKEEQP
jgi:hypothetical protein